MREAAPSGIEAIPILRWGTHLCQAFEAAADLKDVLVPYFTEGLANNESLLLGDGIAAESRRGACSASRQCPRS